MNKKPAQKPPETISDQLRAVIKARSLTAYGINRLSGVNIAMIQRFINGERDLRLGTVDKIAAALGLRLCEVTKDA